jgi:PTH1 family peptidyl-tRNA hydrolase
MILIAGLGNPGAHYKKNRHNAGFIILDAISSDRGQFTSTKKFNADICQCRIADAEVILLKPKTFMNNSGESVSAAVNFYRIEPASLIVLHDEIELSAGLIKHKFGGGHKGHNGLRSIIQHIGSSDYHRIRIGVGRPDDSNISVADHVLSDFSKDEHENLVKNTDAVLAIIAGIIDKE